MAVFVPALLNVTVTKLGGNSGWPDYRDNYRYTVTNTGNFAQDYGIRTPNMGYQINSRLWEPGYNSGERSIASGESQVHDFSTKWFGGLYTWELYGETSPISAFELNVSMDCHVYTGFEFLDVVRYSIHNVTDEWQVYQLKYLDTIEDTVLLDWESPITFPYIAIAPGDTHTGSGYAGFIKRGYPNNKWINGVHWYDSGGIMVDLGVTGTLTVYHPTYRVDTCGAPEPDEPEPDLFMGMPISSELLTPAIGNNLPTAEVAWASIWPYITARYVLINGNWYGVASDRLIIVSAIYGIIVSQDCVLDYTDWQGHFYFELSAGQHSIVWYPRPDPTEESEFKDLIATYT